MKRILVGISDNDRARSIVDWVATFAHEQDAQVLLVHVLPRTGLWVAAGMQLDTNVHVRAMRANLERDALAPLLRAGVSAELRFEIGDPAHALAVTARARRADLIVVGGPRHGALHDALAGSTVTKLEHCADVPVIVLPSVDAAVASNAHA
jgi:nucleotide-binding universal stress UspA family protein